MPAIRNIARELLALLFPPRCGSCGRVVSPHDGGLCPDCAGQTLGLIATGYCNRCGQDAGPFALQATDRPGVSTCGLCDSQLYRYDGLVRVGPYVDPLGQLIRGLKYNGRQYLAGLLSRWQADRLAAQPWIDRIDGFVPVPLHWRRRLGRGFNQAELLADNLAARLHRPLLPLLSRPVHRQPQASLPRSRRFENVRGVFTANQPAEVEGRRLCLVDDVCTTGATLSESARTLRSAGAAEVYAVVVAVAQPPTAYSTMIRDPN